MRLKHFIYSIALLCICSISSFAATGEVVRLEAETLFTDEGNNSIKTLEKDTFIILTEEFTYRPGRRKIYLADGSEGYIPLKAKFIRDEKTYSNSLKYAQHTGSGIHPSIFVQQFSDQWSKQLSPESKLAGMKGKKNQKTGYLEWEIKGQNGVTLGKLIAAQVLPDGNIYNETRMVKDRRGKMRIARNALPPKGTVWRAIEVDTISPAFPMPLGLTVGSPLNKALDPQGLASNYVSSPSQYNTIDYSDDAGGALQLEYVTLNGITLIKRVTYKYRGAWGKPITTNTTHKMKSFAINTGTKIVPPPKPVVKKEQVKSGSAQKKTVKKNPHVTVRTVKRKKK